MKKAIFLFCIVALFLSCKDQKTNPQNYAILSGDLKGLNDSKLILYGGRKYVDTLYLNDEGTFRDTINLKQDYNFYNLIGINGGPRIFISRGDSLHLKYDNEIGMLEGLEFTGNSSSLSLNQFFIDAQKHWANVQGKDVEKFYYLPSEEFQDKLTKIKSGQLALLEKVDVNDSIKDLEKHNIDYLILSLVRSYKSMQAGDGLDNRQVSTILPNYGQIGYNNSADYKYSNHYRGYVSNHYNQKASQLAKNDSIESIDAFFSVINNDSIAEEIRNDLVYNRINFDLTYSSKMDTLYSKFMNVSTSDYDKKEITKVYNALKRIEKGQPSPEFLNYTNFDGGKSSLKDFRGKFLYIDLWATWCGPCLQEIPSLKKIQDQYKNKNITFLSISIDRLEDEEKWREMIQKKDLKGIQLLANDAWNSSIINEYQVRGIPRFIFLDPEGKIISNNAPRPSDPDGIKTLFSEVKNDQV